MNRTDIKKPIATVLILPVVYLLFTFFNDNYVLSFMNFLSYLLLSAVGGAIGAVYAYYAHNLFFKNSFLAGFIPSVVLIFISTEMEIVYLVMRGDLCLVTSCWLIASEVTFMKNKAARYFL